jgi:hypothetical protein
MAAVSIHRIKCQISCGSWCVSVSWDRDETAAFAERNGWLCLKHQYFVMYRSCCSQFREFPWNRILHNAGQSRWILCRVFLLSTANELQYDNNYKIITVGFRPPLLSSGQSFWLQIHRSRVRFPALPHFLRSRGSGTGSTQPREDN